MTVILVFPQSCGGFWGGVTECGSGSTRSSRSIALCSARSHVPPGGSGAGAVPEPVNTGGAPEPGGAARGSPAAAPIPAPLIAGSGDAAGPGDAALTEDPPVSEGTAA